MNETPTKQNRILYMDALRVVATFAIIMLHVSASNWASVDVRSSAWAAFNVYDGLVRWGVPVFVMISGALFLDPSREITLKDLYGKKIRRIVIVYFAWAFVYAAVYALTYGFSWKTLLTQTVAGHYHMWYLVTIAGLYCLVPLIRKITADRAATRYFLILSFLFTALFPLLLFGLQGADTFFGWNGAVYNVVNGVYQNFDVFFVMGFTFYFVMGFYLNSDELPNRTERTWMFIGLLGLPATVLLSKAISYYYNAPTLKFYHEWSVNVMLAAIGIVLLVKRLTPKLIRTEKGAELAHKLSKDSFGVYLIHPLVISLLGRFGLTTVSVSPAISPLLITVITFIVSYAISAVLNRIPFVKKYLV